MPLILFLVIIFLISGITINAFSETSKGLQSTEAITNSTEPLAGKNDQILKQLNNKRQQYYKKKNELVSRHDSEIKQLKDKKTVLNKKIGDAKKEISSLQNNLQKSQDHFLYVARIQKVIAIGLYPLGLIFTLSIFEALSSTDTLSLFLYIFFPLTILNGCIYLYFRERSLFLRKKKAILIAAGILLILFFMPAFASGATSEQPDPLIDKLEKCEQIMSLTDLQRIIKRLESAESQKGKIISLPEMTVRNPILKPLNKVNVGTPSYYFTLAAFYFEDNRKGMAVDAIKKIYDHHSYFADKEQIPFATNGIKFLLEQEQIESASQAIPKVLPYIKDVSVLLDLADFLEKAHMDKSARETLQKAINIASDPDELINLSRFLIKKDRLEDAIQSTGKAIKITKDLSKLIEIITFSMENGMEDIVTAGINKSIRLAGTPEEYFLMVDFLLKNNRLEQAANTLSQAIDSIKKDSKGYAEQLLKLADMALQRKLYEQAVNAVEKLSIYLGINAFDYNIKAPEILPYKDPLPTNKNIALPTYYGILQQKSGFMDKAEISYRNSIVHQLNGIIDGFGFDVKANLNDFYYLWKLYAMKDSNDILSKMDFIYSLLENQYLTNIETMHTSRIEEEREIINELDEKYKSHLQEIKKLNQENFKVSIASFLHSARSLSLLSLIIILLIGCSIKAAQHAKKLSSYKSYGFIGKFIECIGWVDILKVVNIPAGILTIFIAQAMQIFQRHEQYTEKIFNLNSIGSNFTTRTDEESMSKKVESKKSL